jgi:hypothetical protein
MKHAIDQWEGCYPSNWKGLIIQEAMAHPAKFSNKLIRRIYEHLQEEGWVKPGDRVIDPFGGVALGALDAMRLGLNWYGMELEAKFHELGSAQYLCNGIQPDEWKRWYSRPKMLAFFREHRLLCPPCEAAWNDISNRKIPSRDAHTFRGNIPLWENKFRDMPNFGTAHLLYGDSRHLLELLNDYVQVSVSSPPYADGCSHTGGDDPHPEKARGGQLYGVGIALGVSSPPYAETDLNYKRNGLDYHRPYMDGQSGVDNYGATPGQLGALKAKGFEAAISSPPFLQSEGGTPELKPGGSIDAALYKRHAAGNKSADGYGSSDGQLSSMKDGSFEAAVSSPPYNPPMSQDHNGKRGGKRGTTPSEPGAFVKYGNSDGQLEGMDMDGFMAAISSPPYSAMQVEKNSTSIDRTKQYEIYRKSGGGQSFEQFCRTQELHSQGYGHSDGQLSDLPAGDFNAAVSSPPFQKGSEGVLRADKFKEPEAFARVQMLTGHGASFEAKMRAMKKDNERAEYGQTEGQLGNMTGDFDVSVSSPPYEDSDQNYKAGWERFHKTREPLHANDIQREAEYGSSQGQLSVSDDFWLAARAIVEQVYLALAPGGHAVWVVKDYVKAKKIVPFCDQWRQLCEAVGFVTLHEHHAMLVHHKGTQHTLDGGTVEKKTESKSFFRRLAEKNGSPRIDWETVYCMEKPCTTITNP